MLLLTQPSFSTWTSLPLKAKHYRNHQSRKFVEEETEASKGERNKNKSYLKHQYSIYYILLFFKPVSYYLFTNISLLCYDCFTGWRGRMSYTRCCCHCRKQSLAARSSTRWHCLNCCSRSDIPNYFRKVDCSWLVISRFNLWCWNNICSQCGRCWCIDLLILMCLPFLNCEF